MIQKGAQTRCMAEGDAQYVPLSRFFHRNARYLCMPQENKLSEIPHLYPLANPVVFTRDIPCTGPEKGEGWVEPVQPDALFPDAHPKFHMCVFLVTMGCILQE